MAEAWTMLQDADKVADDARLTELIEIHGLQSGADLALLQQPEIADLALTLKSVPQRRFLQLF